jgi:hypothetical protein
MARRVLPHPGGHFHVGPLNRGLSGSKTFRRINPTNLVGQARKCNFAVADESPSLPLKCQSREIFSEQEILELGSSTRIAAHAARRSNDRRPIGQARQSGALWSSIHCTPISPRPHHSAPIFSATAATVLLNRGDAVVSRADARAHCVFYKPRSTHECAITRRW